MATKKTGPGGVANEPQTTGFKATGGTTTQKVLTVSADVTLDQDLQTSASPTFAGLTIDTQAITEVQTSLTDSDAALPTSGAVVDYVASNAGKLPVTVKTESFTAEVNKAYIMNTSGSVCVGTLPETAAVGDAVVFIGLGSGGHQALSAAGQTIACYNLTTKTAGYVQAMEQYQVIELRCIAANTTWEVVSSGAFTVETS